MDSPSSDQTAATRAVFEELLGYWSVQDVELTASLLADDARSEVHFDHAEVPASGVIRGRHAIAAALYGNLAIWFYLEFNATIMSVEGDTGRAHIQFAYQHQRTGLRFQGTMRMEIVAAAGFVTRIDFHHDGPKVAAFMKLIAAQEAALSRPASEPQT